jgi:hypothetical protein
VANARDSTGGNQVRWECLPAVCCCFWGLFLAALIVSEGFVLSAECSMHTCGSGQGVSWA